ncbi:MAG: PepSY domain-containing protein, partial [Sphingomonadales bacterium]
PGSYVVELAASWAIVMILSGLFLWWPRGGGMAGILYPRLRPGRMWRDLHAVTGFWISFFALFMLLSGLPWATSWGSYLKAVRAVAEGSASRPDWMIGAAPMNHGTTAMMGEHAEHGGMTMAHPPTSSEPLDRLIAAIRPLGLAAPVLIAPPTAPDQLWTAKSDAANRPLRSELGLDGASGQILTRKDFAERRLVDRIVGYGIAVHEGQLFGLANQLLNLAIAIGLVLLSVSSVVLWWRRKPDEVLGAPPALGGPPVAIGFVALLICLGLLLPLFGATMVAVLLIERLVLRRMPGARRWLGLKVVSPA